jgi:hypothetical protein
MSITTKKYSDNSEFYITNSKNNGNSQITKKGQHYFQKI